MSKTVVYIDGENAFFQIFDELRRQKEVRYREDLVKFDLKWLLDKTLEGIEDREYRYYGVKLKEISSSDELLKRTQRMIDHKRRWIGYLSNQDINFIEAGQLVVRDISGPGSKEMDLTFEEKGVDVKLAVDMVEDVTTKKVKNVVVFSSDTDLMSAIHAVQGNDGRAVYLTHQDRINDVLTGSADETRSFSSEDIKEAFKRAN